MNSMIHLMCFFLLMASAHCYLPKGYPSYGGSGSSRGVIYPGVVFYDETLSTSSSSNPRYSDVKEDVVRGISTIGSVQVPGSQGVIYYDEGGSSSWTDNPFESEDPKDVLRGTESGGNAHGTGTRGGNDHGIIRSGDGGGEDLGITRGWQSQDTLRGNCRDFDSEDKSIDSAISQGTLGIPNVAKDVGHGGSEKHGTKGTGTDYLGGSQVHSSTQSTVGGHGNFGNWGTAKDIHVVKDNGGGHTKKGGSNGYHGILNIQGSRKDIPAGHDRQGNKETTEGIIVNKDSSKEHGIFEGNGNSEEEDGITKTNIGGHSIFGIHGTTKTTQGGHGGLGVGETGVSGSGSHVHLETNGHKVKSHGNNKESKIDINESHVESEIGITQGENHGSHHGSGILKIKVDNHGEKTDLKPDSHGESKEDTLYSSPNQGIKGGGLYNQGTQSGYGSNRGVPYGGINPSYGNRRIFYGR